MRVMLKHVNTVRKRLRSGEIRTYHYHRLTGKRIEGEPGSPQFLLSWQQAAKTDFVPDGTVKALIQEYMQSHDYARLRDKTREDYSFHLARIEKEFGDTPLAVLNDPAIRTDFLDWRDKIGHTSLRQADYAWSVLRRMLGWALNKGRVSFNHAIAPGRLYKTNRSEKIWTDADIKTFMEAAPEPVRNVFLMALYTGQRQGDLLSLAWSAYDGHCIRLRQSKTGRQVYVPCAPELRMLIDRLPKVATTMLTTSRGASWNPHNFRCQLREICLKIGIADKRFHDLRGTYVTRRSEDGWTTQEIAAITGHSLKQVEAILDVYLARTEALADGAMKKMRHGG